MPFISTPLARYRAYLQTPCSVCGIKATPLRTFSIRLRPESWQSIGTRLKLAFTEEIRQHWVFRDRQSGLERDCLCLRFVFCLGPSDRLKDVDNLAKGLLDSLQGRLYVNDRQIAHLDVLRLTGLASEGSIAVRIARTLVNVHDDVIDQRYLVDWQNVNAIDIRDIPTRESRNSTGP